MRKDKDYLRRCISLSEQSLASGELPFGSLIVKEGKVITDSGNETKKKNDVTQHAEIIVIRNAQKLLQTSDLSDCILYSHIEPCAMCSFMIRELKFSRVVFALFSPVMGGYSRFALLQDLQLYKALPSFYSQPPKIVAGILRDEAAVVWNKWRSLNKLSSPAEYRFQ